MLATISEETSVSRLVHPRAQTVWLTVGKDRERAAFPSADGVRRTREKRFAQSIEYTTCRG
jgi:hypothetical protein